MATTQAVDVRYAQTGQATPDAIAGAQYIVPFGGYPAGPAIDWGKLCRPHDDRHTTVHNGTVGTRRKRKCGGEVQIATITPADGRKRGFRTTACWDSSWRRASSAGGPVVPHPAFCDRTGSLRPALLGTGFLEPLSDVRLRIP